MPAPELAPRRAGARGGNTVGRRDDHAGGSGTLILTPVRASDGLGLWIVTVAAVGWPAATVSSAKSKVTVGAWTTESVALAAAPLPPLDDEIGDVVLTAVPSVSR